MIHLLRQRGLMILALFLLTSLALRAQQTQNVTVTGTGGVAGMNSTMQVQGTLGQPIIGTLHSPQFSAQQGFWFYRVQSSLLTEVPVTGMSSDSPGSLHCFPNPVSESATISFYVPEEAWTQLVLYNALGKEVMNLIDGDQLTGRMTVELNSEEIATGIYSLVLIVNQHRTTLPLRIIR